MPPKRKTEPKKPRKTRAKAQTPPPASDEAAGLEALAPAVPHVESLIAELKSTENANFDEYKRLAEEKMDTYQQVIQLLTEKSAAPGSSVRVDGKLAELGLVVTSTAGNKENTQNSTDTDAELQRLRKEVAELRARVANTSTSTSASANANTSTSPGSDTVAELEKRIEKNAVIFDLIESVCGFRVSNVDDTDLDNLAFDCVQGGVNGTLSYELVLSRVSNSSDKAEEASESDDNVEMVYNPKLEDDTQLRDVLPDYFFDSLTFPVETLPQFFQKLSRALNKEKK